MDVSAAAPVLYPRDKCRKFSLLTLSDLASLSLRVCCPSQLRSLTSGLVRTSSLPSRFGFPFEVAAGGISHLCTAQPPTVGRTGAFPIWDTFAKIAEGSGVSACWASSARGVARDEGPPNLKFPSWYPSYRRNRRHSAWNHVPGEA